MTKTKQHDACAVRDFDTERILQRRRFKQYNLPSGTDEEILSWLDVSPMTEQAPCENRIAVWFLVKEDVATLGRQIGRQAKRHAQLVTRWLMAGEKLGDYSDARFERLTAIMKAYEEPLTAIKILFEKLVKLGRANEKVAQKIYRLRFAQNLKAARVARGITQKQVAAMLGSNVPTISDYERGEVAPSFRNLARLSDILNVTIDSLIKQ